MAVGDPFSDATVAGADKAACAAVETVRSKIPGTVVAVSVIACVADNEPSLVPVEEEEDDDERETMTGSATETLC